MKKLLIFLLPLFLFAGWEGWGQKPKCLVTTLNITNTSPLYACVKNTFPISSDGLFTWAYSSGDSVILDSIRMIIWAQNDSNIVDSIFIAPTYVDTLNATAVWGDGTNKTILKTGAYIKVRWNAIAKTLAGYGRYKCQIKGGQMAATGNIEVESCEMWYHPK